jgi:hypothetical protein
MTPANRELGPSMNEDYQRSRLRPRRQVESRMSVRLGRMFRHKSVLYPNKFSSAESSFLSSNRSVAAVGAYGQAKTLNSSRFGYR